MRYIDNRPTWTMMSPQKRVGFSVNGRGIIGAKADYYLASVIGCNPDLSSIGTALVTLRSYRDIKTVRAQITLNPKNDEKAA